MTKTMLIDATHPEETRVAVVDNRRLEEFDVEVASRHPLKGNIYLAKVTRVEPSLQAAFVEYGGNRHGFLAFSEIHPDYYRIPVADREALLREEMEEAAAETDDTRRGRDAGSGERGRRRRAVAEEGPDADPADAGPAPEVRSADLQAVLPSDNETHQHVHLDDRGPFPQAAGDAPAPAAAPWPAQDEEEGSQAVMPLAVGYDIIRSEPVSDPEFVPGNIFATAESGAQPDPVEQAGEAIARDSVPDFPADPSVDAEVPAAPHADIVEVVQPPEVIDTVGGEEPAAAEDSDDDDDDSDRRRRQRHLRRYKIQEVIKRRQILLVQVTKEERGNKGAALTTYMSLAGRYCVLMPNTDRGGGISRRITSVTDRKRLKSIVDELDPPEGMAVIVRTAGMERQQSEIKRDFEYLLRLWDEIRENTLRSSAPALIYEEASLIKRSIRDLYTRDIGDIVVAGAEAYKSARSFMRMLAPAHAKRVQFYRDPSLPLFQRHQIESQIAAIHHPVVNLRSGGYIVINQTEALVAVDVNSGRSTRERNIEETALRTNLEAAEEVARQLRLRDLAGLIVIDFIDMDESRNNAAVERRMKDALRNDRARIQIGRISSFGLLEMSRQRLHASLQEASTEACPHCHGTGRMRSVDSTALHVLRMVEEEITRNPSAGVNVHVPSSVALYILNQKRHALAQLELRRGVRIYLSADDELTPPDFRLERIKLLLPGEELPPAPPPAVIDIDFDETEDDIEEIEETEAQTDAGDGSEAPADRQSDEEGAEQGRGRGRRRRGRGGRFQADEFTEQASPDSDGSGAEPGDDGDAGTRRRGAVERPTATEHQATTETEAARHGEETGRGDDAGDDDERPENPEGSTAETDEQHRRRRRGRRGGRRRSRRAQEGGGLADEPRTQGNGETRDRAGNVPPIGGLGEQPSLPADGDVLPPLWRGGPDGSGGQAGGEGRGIGKEPARDMHGRGERTRRPRRPRREPDGGEGAAEPVTASGGPARFAGESVAARPAPAMAEPTRREEPATARPATESPVAVVRVGESASTSAAGGDEPKKRGWWRRLIE